jgi:AcrR family transcriptional regulator
LIEAGRKLFSEKGLYEARIEDLTAMAGIAKGTLYTYFPNKDELIRAVASAGFAELERLVALRVRGARNEEDLLRRAVRGHLQYFGKNPDMMRVFHQVRGMLKFDRAEWQPLRVTLNAYLEWLARVLSGTPRVRGMRAPGQQGLASVLFGAISGVTSVEAASGRPAAASAAGRSLIESLVAMAREYVSACDSYPYRMTNVGSRLGRVDGPRRRRRTRRDSAG